MLSHVKPYHHKASTMHVVAVCVCVCVRVCVCVHSRAAYRKWGSERQCDFSNSGGGGGGGSSGVVVG